MMKLPWIKVDGASLSSPPPSLYLEGCVDKGEGSSVRQQVNGTGGQERDYSSINERGILGTVQGEKLR